MAKQQVGGEKLCSEGVKGGAYTILTKGGDHKVCMDEIMR